VLGRPRRNEDRAWCVTDRGVRRAAYQRSPHRAVAARAEHDQIGIGPTTSRIEADSLVSEQDVLLNPRTVNEDRERGVTDY